MRSWFQDHIVRKIISTNPPSEGRGEDKYYWKPSSDGCFSVSSAYKFISAGVDRSHSKLWRALWRWQIPEKIKTFMWLAAHGRAHTAQLRNRRGITDHASCPFQCVQDEDLMHLLRDCDNARERWISIVKPGMWVNFTNLQGADWIEWNLKNAAGREFTKKVSWPTLFGYVCWDIWVDRCRKLFGEEENIDNHNALSSFFRASWDMDLSAQCNFYNQVVTETGDQQPREQGFYSLEADGSVLDSGQSGSAGVIRDEEGDWVCGYMSRLTQVPPSIAEIIAIIQGLQICWNRNFKKLILYTDCIEAVNLLTRG